MQRHDLLRGLHDVLAPRTYFEIGVRKGASLTLSRVPSVGVDPFYVLSREVLCDLHLVRTTSDEFFARKEPFAHFDRPRVDLAFIDGMHLSEFALRDVINTERYCGPASVIVIDDMLPRNVIEAGRGRVGAAEHGAWAGDVFKIIDSLRRHRPDLVVLELDTQPTGTGVILLPDRDNKALHRVYDQLVVDYVVPDPQVVPDDVMSRRRAIAPEDLLDAPIWADIRRARDLPDDRARPAIQEIYAGAGLANPKEA